MFAKVALGLSFLAIIIAPCTSVYSPKKCFSQIVEIIVISLYKSNMGIKCVI